MQNCNALICMPTTTPNIKVNAVKRLGSDVMLIGDSYQETQEYAIVMKDPFAFQRTLLVV